jgi:hypothetical protein
MHRLNYFRPNFIEEAKIIEDNVVETTNYFNQGRVRIQYMIRIVGSKCVMVKHAGKRKLKYQSDLK